MRSWLGTAKASRMSRGTSTAAPRATPATSATSARSRAPCATRRRRWAASTSSSRFAAVEDTPTDEWREILDTNLTGTFLVFRETLPHVRRARGHLFAIASIAATRPFAQSAAYSASKAGVRALAAVVAEEVRREGVRVTTIIPGAVDTPFWDRAGGTELDRSRMLRPDDVARAILRAAAEPETTSIDEIVVMPAEGVL